MHLSSNWLKKSAGEPELFSATITSSGDRIRRLLPSGPDPLLAIALLQAAFELVLPAVDEIVIGQLAPIDLALDLLPVSFDAVPVPCCSP